MEFIDQIDECYCVLLQLLINDVITAFDINQKDHQNNWKYYQDKIKNIGDKFQLTTIEDDNRLIIFKEYKRDYRSACIFRKNNNNGKIEYTIKLVIGESTVVVDRCILSHEYVNLIVNEINNINKQYGKNYGLIIEKTYTTIETPSINDGSILVPYQEKYECENYINRKKRKISSS